MNLPKPPQKINLASDPFRAERTELAAFLGLCGILVCSLFVLTGMIFHARAQASDVRRQIALQQTQLAALQNQARQYSSVLAKPENAGIFANSVFLNELISRRGVSWTHAFQDLGTVLPGSVRLLAIRLPQVNSGNEKGANRVQLDMIVGTAQPESVISLLKNLQKSPLFGSASMVSQTPPSQNDPLFKYRITVTYDQKL